jgi:hypothetical protein
MDLKILLEAFLNMDVEHQRIILFQKMDTHSSEFKEKKQSHYRSFAEFFNEN